MKVRVDHDLCCAYGFCVRIVPDVLTLDDEGKAISLVETVPPDQESGVRRAARTCPTAAIVIDE